MPSVLAVLLAVCAACEARSAVRRGEGEAAVGPADASSAAPPTPPTASAPSTVSTPPSRQDVEGPTCAAPQIPDEEVKRIIQRERATRKDLPAPFPKATWTIRRDGCHYTAIESLDPPTPDANHIFKLNQRGVVVDASVGISPGGPLKCPERILSEAQLARIVAAARATRKDLPPPFAQSRIQVSRMRCLYSYFEYRVPERRGDYQVFIVDPLGELMEVQRSQPY